MADNLNEKLKRLQEAKKKAEDISQKRQRLAGERDSHQKRLEELEKKCQTDYGCGVTELPGLIKQLESEAEGAIAEAEKILATPGSSPVEVTPPVTKPAMAPVKPAAPARPVMPPIRKRPSQDDDPL